MYSDRLHLCQIEQNMKRLLPLHKLFHIVLFVLMFLHLISCPSAFSLIGGHGNLQFLSSVEKKRPYKQSKYSIRLLDTTEHPISLDSRGFHPIHRSPSAVCWRVCLVHFHALPSKQFPREPSCIQQAGQGGWFISIVLFQKRPERF